MRQIININGFETPIEIPEGQTLSPVTAQGDKTNYRIEYGNGLVELGGTVDVTVNRVAEGVLEGIHNVALSFSTTLSVQVTAMNVIQGAETLNSESAFITDTTDGFRIYATARSTAETQVIPVRWVAKGLI